MESTNNQKIMQAAKILNKDENSSEHHDVSEEKISIERKLRDDIKRREQEQTQKLLVGLTNELFEKVEKMSAKKKLNEQKTTVEKSESQETTSGEAEFKIEFSDLSWYREKLASKDEKTHKS
jgi:hypothetical protein